MAVRNDITVDFSSSPRIAEIADPSTTVTIQDLYDTLSVIQARLENASFPVVVKAGGKDDLGGGRRVGVTLTLQNTRLAFQARPGPSYVQCTVTDGNLVAVNASNAAMAAIHTTAFTQIIINQSTAPTLVGAATPAEVWDLSDGIESALTPRQALRLIAAALAGRISGAGGTTVTIRNAVADSKSRIVATVDSSGNRSAITTDTT